MGMPKYAASCDANQQEIVDALRAMGCGVEIIGTPVDLLVCARGYNLLMEVKMPDARPRKDQQHQRDWMANWREMGGQVRVVTSADEACRLARRAYKRREK